MLMSRLIALASFGMGVGAASAADATTPVDYTQRNTPFAPAGNVTPGKKTPETNEALQEKRVEKTTIEKETSPLGERRAAIEMKEAQEKNVRAKDARKPEVKDQKKSAFDHRNAAISTSGDQTKPPTVAKYQDSLAAASASNMARFPALDDATSAKINRFVFRKNPPDAQSGVGDSRVVPAAGGSPLTK